MEEEFQISHPQTKRLERRGEKYFGGGIKKEISPGVNLEGSFEKEGDLKRGNIKLKVDL